MATRINDPSSVLGSTIETVSSSIKELHPHTGHRVFRFVIQLADGLVMDLGPGDLLACDGVPEGMATAQLRVMDGPPTVSGEHIVAVVSQGVPNPDKDIPRQMALILSSGRAAMNAYVCGGGNLFHVESLAGFTRYNGREWTDYWTDEAVEIEKLALAPK